ncbi:MAG: hypothetical protein D8M57_12500 [Candidatus Scalindua sp. AMX11]|nr:MAG: hypothetical protein DWQ00_00150 [Candidatus Scalindua sp.]NOG83197.1 hypothetical protein [Planctomycetota bacterium]RZV77562.1 MAG: hypothetical protein EX341_11670 [Candidatus Scalindua sp. SCAELEC01]TDE64558.1 MAG: hypothetical protein D8M57_12500 [Candidatus Scalindua sp. AMX11]GJQ58628.1 MAG: hypothetical protein SCALA701_14290 [Candidatus Scalindua sp.]
MSGTNPRIHGCLVGIICFIIVGLGSIKGIMAVEMEDASAKERILDILESIPQSAGHINLGPIEISPSFKLTGLYDDNVFDSASRRIRAHNDMALIYEPKISLALPVRNHSFAFDYGMKIFDYQGRYELHNTEQDHVNRNWGGSADFNFANGFNIKLADRVQTTTMPGRFTRRSNAQITDPVDIEDGIAVEPVDDEILETFGFNTFTTRRTFTTNEASITIDLPDFFNKIDFSLTYINRDISYKEFTRREQDRNSNLFIGKVQIKPLPKINITTGFSYDSRRYDVREGADSTLKRVPFNILWRFTVKSHFFLNSAYNWRNYGSGIYADFHGFEAKLGYRFNITRRDLLTLKVERSLVEQQFQQERIVDLTIPPSQIDQTDIISPGRGDNNPQHWTQIGFDYTHQFSRNISLTFSPVWQRRKFRDRDFLIGEDGTFISTHREIDTIQFELAGRYTAPRGWLFGEFFYKYQDRDSNIPGGDLVKNSGGISIGLNF